MLFGERLRTHRQRRGITQDELALLTGVSARTIRNLESGRIGTARPSTARLLADALALHGAERDHFLGEDETPRVPDAEQWGAWPTPAQLPADVAGFTGRTGHLRQLTGLLDADAMPAAVVITAISGTAGIGKTALAVHWAHQVRDRFPGGQLYVNLRGYDPDQPVTAAEALAQFLVALGVPARSCRWSWRSGPPGTAARSSSGGC